MDKFLFSQKELQNAISYAQYREIIDQLLSEGKTSGADHSPFMVSYTKQNVERMNLLDNNVTVSESLISKVESLKSNYLFLVLTEAWCGDASQIIPVLDELAKVSKGKIEVRLLWRDENPEIMDRHLTNGGKSIPKLIIVDKENLQEINSWGPRPQILQELATEWKNDADYSLKNWSNKIHAWYHENKTVEIQKEIELLLQDL